MGEAFYQELAKRAAAQWKTIALHLGVESDFLDQLRLDFPPGVGGNVVNCARRVFLRWSKSGGKTLKDLHDALVEAKEGALARFVFQTAKYQGETNCLICIFAYFNNCEQQTHALPSLKFQ